MMIESTLSQIASLIALIFYNLALKKVWLMLHNWQNWILVNNLVAYKY